MELSPFINKPCPNDGLQIDLSVPHNRIFNQDMNTQDMNALINAERSELYKKYISEMEQDLPEVKVKYHLQED
ncbi:MAG: hypothetical protein R2809_10355 [Flavobacteriales bacterium]